MHLPLSWLYSTYCPIATLAFTGNIYLFSWLLTGPKYARRNDPQVIQARLAAILVNSICTAAFTFGCLAWLTQTGQHWQDFVHSMTWHFGWSRHQWIRQAILPLLLTFVPTIVVLLTPIYIDIVAPKRRNSASSIAAILKDNAQAFFSDCIPDFDRYFLRTFLLGPLSEEICFRACMLVWLRAMTSMSPFQCILYSATCFSLAHAHPVVLAAISSLKDRQYSRILYAGQGVLPQCLFTLAFGVYCGIIYIKSDNTLTCTIVHAFCNAIGSFLVDIDFDRLDSPSHKRVMALYIVVGLFTLLLTAVYYQH